MFLVSTLYGRKVDIMSRDKKGRFALGGESEKRRSWLGERFGKLTVIGVQFGVRRGKKARTICTCKCDCGNVVETVADNLQQGKKTSCGCDTRCRRVESLRIDLTGQRFGRLTVLEMIWSHPHTTCRCLCDCGNEVNIINTQLTSGKTQSCGCLQRERTSNANTKDFTNTQTGSGIKFIRRYKKRETVDTGGGLWIWECECPICGKHFYGVPSIIQCTNQKSCGCLSPTTSIGEEFVKNLLDQNSIKYIKEYTTDDCKNIKRLKFDFALLDDDGNVSHIIEYDGIQHFAPVEYFGGEEAFKENKMRDEIKNDYCRKNNIPMTRLPYTMSFEEVEDTIKNIINP